MSVMASHFTDHMTNCSTAYTGWHQRKHWSTSLALCEGIPCLFNSLSSHIKEKFRSLHYWPFLKGIDWWPVDSPHKGLVMQKVFPCHDVIILQGCHRSWIMSLISLANHYKNIVNVKTPHHCLPVRWNRLIGRFTTQRATQIAKLMRPTWAHLGPVSPRWAPCWPHGPC